MPTVSIVRRRRPRHPVRLLAALLPLLGAGCLTAPGVVVEDLLEPLVAPTTYLPTPGDLAAARLARAALIAHPRPAIANAVEAPGPDAESEPPHDARRASGTHSPSAPDAVSSALQRLQQVATPQEQRRLVPLAIDLHNTTLDDPIAYREASRALRRRGDLDPRLESRLETTIDSDPLRLARHRDFDAWHRLWARTFNTLSEPLGSSLITGFVLAPYQLGNSVLHYFAAFSNTEPLSSTGRQALTLRQDFLAAHPDTELTEPLETKVEKALVRLEKTLALRRLRAAERATSGGDARLARAHLESAESILTRHPDRHGRLRARVAKHREQVDQTIAESERLRARALAAQPTELATRAAERALAMRLLAGPLEPGELERPLADYARAAGPDAHGRVEFIRALAQHEDGHERAARKRLARLAGTRRYDDPMTRHAQALQSDAWQNPYDAFRRLARRGRREELAWRLAGDWINRPRYPNLPAPIAYLIDTPTIAMTIVMAPLRAIISPWTGAPDFQRATALAGYRYLGRFPEGEEQREVLEWLYDYEDDRERYGRALRLADLIPDFDPETRAELVEKTTEERLARLDRIDRRDTRASMLEGVAREFPDSAGGKEAGLLARADYQDASPQRIRITRDFLLENPSVAGRGGIGLNPKLLNDDPRDGELHPDGVLLRGGRVLEILLLAEGADEDEPAEPRVRKVSPERLRQIAAALEEAVQRNGLIDPGARQAPDANRDLYLERASLGLTEQPDLRATAESDFVYQSLRERYGMVRGRDSILPFDLVFRGNLGDFTLGAFPRWRPPPETPDAFLYR